MNEKLRQVLINAASSRKTITYSALAYIMGVPKAPKGYSKALYSALTALGWTEYKAGAPLLNSIVTSKSDGQPSLGFYRWYRNNVDSTFDPYSTNARSELFAKLKSECFSRWGSSSKLKP
jgi:hypothetical protein